MENVLPPLSMHGPDEPDKAITESTMDSPHTTTTHGVMFIAKSSIVFEK
ncbi:hypothetical protein [Amycolatopsis decaplanina]|nr:hypothetical protein [Amycolatopsis decaplanina]